jgi:hypothetical protein
MTYIGLAFIFAASTTVLFAAVSIPFLNTLKAEAPSVFASFGSPSPSDYLIHRKIWMPFSRMVLFRKYREVLAPYPRSKAWASWLFVAHWLQVFGLVVFVVSIAYR